MTNEVEPNRPALPYTIAILGSFLIVAVLVWAMMKLVQPPPTEDRPAARAKALAEMRAAEHEAQTTTAWIDQAKGLVRLRTEDAMNIVARDWGRDPGQARSNLIARVEKATAKPPEKPSQFE